MTTVTHTREYEIIEHYNAHPITVLFYMLKQKLISKQEFMTILCNLNLIKVPSIGCARGSNIIMYRNHIHLAKDSFTEKQINEITTTARRDSFGDSTGYITVFSVTKEEEIFSNKELLNALLEAML